MPEGTCWSRCCPVSAATVPGGGCQALEIFEQQLKSVRVMMLKNHYTTWKTGLGNLKSLSKSWGDSFVDKIKHRHCSKKIFDIHIPLTAFFVILK